MKWFWKQCSRMEETCLLAAGVLPAQDRPELEQHLAACRSCQSYYNEIKAVAMPLASWEKSFAQIERTRAMQERWAEAVQSSGGNPSWREPHAENIWRKVWRELVWPSRRAWVGLAAIWLALLGINARLADHPKQMAGLHSPSEIMQSWEEQTRVLAELTQPAMFRSAAANPPLAPANPPRPRSERKQAWQIG